MKKKDKLKSNPDRLKLVSGTKGTFKDLKRQAVILGMPFPEVSESGVFDLIGYIQKHTLDVNPDTSLIDKYDEWISKHFDEIGIPQDDAIRSSRLRLGFLGDKDKETGERKPKRIPGIKKIRVHKEKDSHGHIKGTKKSYTWECAEKGFDLDRTKRRVLKKFPDANEKSIQLWYRAAKRKLKDEGV
jgi:hypothetical protein